MTHWTLVRHGVTDANRSGIIQGSRDIPLNTEGLQQARMTGRVLSSERFDAIWSSPLQRTLQTAHGIGKFQNQPIQTSELLIEKCFGEFENQPIQALIAAEQNHTGSLYDYCPKGGESNEQLFQRLKHFKDEQMQQSYRNLLVVGHAGSLKALIGALMNWPFERWFNINLSNASISQLRVNDEGNVEAFVLNDIAHFG